MARRRPKIRPKSQVEVLKSIRKPLPRATIVKPAKKRKKVESDDMTIADQDEQRCIDSGWGNDDETY